MATATVNFLGASIEVEYSYYPAQRGYRNSYGAPEEPDCPASIEVERVMFGGQDVTEFIGEMDRISDVETLVWEARE